MSATNNELSEKQWIILKSQWLSDNIGDFSTLDEDSRFNFYLRYLKKHRIQEVGGMVLDLIIGGIIFTFGVYGLINAYNIFTFDPGSQVIHSFLNDVPKPSIENIYTAIQMYLFFFGITLTGAYIPITSFYIRFKAKKAFQTQTMDVAKLAMYFFDTKISLNRLSQKIALVIVILLWGIQLSGMIIRPGGISSLSAYSFVLGFGILIFFPGTIYYVARKLMLQNIREKASFIKLMR